jgi:cytochrome c oxidase assembly protein subunit 15
LKPASATAVSPWPHRFAVLLALVTFPLIWVGGLVTTYDAGMAVEDWPGTYGYNLFLYPWQTWLAGPWDLFIEHGHRLLGATAGLVAIALVVSTWLTAASRPLRVGSAALLLFVILQGVLGGLRVLMDARLLALIHGCTGPLFFASAVVVAAASSRHWRVADPAAGNSRFRSSAWALFLAATLQLIAGANVRHLPHLGNARGFQAAVVFHIALALGVAWAAARCVTAAGSMPHELGASRWSLLVAALVGLQLALGVATWVAKYAWPEWFEQYHFAAAHVVQSKSLPQALTVTAHVANGSLILAGSAVLAAKAMRLTGLSAPLSHGELAA